MSEYQTVEKPFLDQLASLGWEVIEQGPGIPTDPTLSCRTSFREVILKGLFQRAVRFLNRTEDGQEWLTDKQLDDLYDELTHLSSPSLIEANELTQALLYRTQVDRNELTGEEFPNVSLIDFQNPDNNHFLAINQFRVDTPGGVKAYIIPDIVLFVNGLPLVVVECKVRNEYTAQPLFEAFRQLMRYSDQREDPTSGLREGEERLFYTNQFLICTCGDQAQVGTITATEEEYFFPWRSIYPERYQTYTPPLGEEREQEVLIQGMLPPEIFLDIIRNCILFMDVGKTRAKVVCRYQQYRAACKIIERLRTGETAMERSGVVWHTQGSGKSLSMVFVIRKLRRCLDLKDYKVCLVCDRKDLEKQLGETATLAGEQVTTITSSGDLKTQLATDASNLNMVMIHKFQENQATGPDYLESALEQVPNFELFGVVNNSNRILLMVDEAHRTQSGDLGDNLFAAFPNAARIAFTGTPLIVVQDQKKTVDRFGDYIDKYKLQDAVDDGVTVQILYEGKAADTAVENKHEFDQQVGEAAEQYVTSQLRKSENVERLQRMAERQKKPFDDLVAERTAEEILALKKKWGTNGDLLEAEQRIEAIANDLVNHYIDNILPNGFKAQVVCSSKIAAVRYKKFIDQAIQARLALEEAKPIWIDESTAIPEEERDRYKDPERCRRIAFLQSAVVVSSDGTNEKAEIVAARKHAKAVNAVDNFKRSFNYSDPEKVNTGVALLIVCDMLLTGFDAPIEQVMYIDKKIRDHNLLQTIARVNRIASGKSRGYIIDYIGLANHLKEALSIYAASDQADIQATLTDITTELPVLEARYRRLLQLFQSLGIEAFVLQTLSPEQESATQEAAIEAMADPRQRANFEVYLKKFMQSLDIILPNTSAHPYKIPAKRFGYLLAKIKERYKDDSLSFSGSGEKVKKLIDEHLISLGINPKIPPVELLSPNFIQQVEQNKTSKAKASEMEHAIRKHCKVHFPEDPALYTCLSEKLEALIQKYNDDWDELSKTLFEVYEEALAGRQDGTNPFYDLIAQIAFGEEGVPQQQQIALHQLVEEIIEKLRNTINIVNFWNNQPEVSRLKGELSDLILFSGIDPLAEQSEKLAAEVTALAKARQQHLRL